MTYYMMTIYIDNETKKKNYRPFINPYDSLKEAQNAVRWQNEGGFKEENVICKRIDTVKFQRIDTKEVFNINKEDRTPYTFDAWGKFINRTY